MGSQAKILKVLIASPSDVQDERTIISEAIYAWNAINAEHEHIVLLPVKWETHSTPEYSGENPQEILNRQIVRDCDLLISAMWTKLGTPTKKHESGTVEEIMEFIQSGKQIMIYFSTQSLPTNVDTIELERLRAFKKVYQGQGIYKEYGSLQDLKSIILDDLTRKIREINRGEKNRLEQSQDEIIEVISIEETRKIVLGKITRYLSENERIFLEYGPFSLRANNPLSESAKIWEEKCVEEIIPNNESIIDLLRQNDHLIPGHKKDIFSKFINHVEGLKQNHLTKYKDKDVPTFPQEIKDILES